MVRQPSLLVQQPPNVGVQAKRSCVEPGRVFASWRQLRPEAFPDSSDFLAGRNTRHTERLEQLGCLNVPDRTRVFPDPRIDHCRNENPPSVVGRIRLERATTAWVHFKRPANKADRAPSREFDI